MEKGIIAELPQSETIDTDKILQQYLDGETDLVRPHPARQDMPYALRTT